MTPKHIHTLCITLWITLWTALPRALKASLYATSLAALASGCGTPSSALNNTSDGQLLGGAQSGDFAARIADADALWATRDHLPDLRAAIALYALALDTASPDLSDADRRVHMIALYTRLARAHFLLGDAVLPLSVPDPEAIKAEATASFDQGRAYAERALGLLHPPLLAAAQSGQDLSEAIAAIDDPAAAGPMFWWVSNLGRWMQTQNPFTALSFTDDLDRVGHRAYALDPAYLNAAPTAFLAGYYTQLPLPSGDAALSKRYFDEAIERAPHTLAHRVAFATLYATKVNDRALFERTLQGVIQTDPDDHPDSAPENRLERQRAQHILNDPDPFF
jgi:hypothetical protein